MLDKVVIDERLKLIDHTFIISFFRISPNWLLIGKIMENSILAEMKSSSGTIITGSGNMTILNYTGFG